MTQLAKFASCFIVVAALGGSFAFAQDPGQFRTNEEAATVEINRDSQAAFAITPSTPTDTYCRDNSDTYPPCDDDFKNKCSGTMSGPQGWGGQTCFTTSGGRAPE